MYGKNRYAEGLSNAMVIMNTKTDIKTLSNIVGISAGFECDTIGLSPRTPGAGRVPDKSATLLQAMLLILVKLVAMII